MNVAPIVIIPSSHNLTIKGTGDIYNLHLLTKQ